MARRAWRCTSPPRVVVDFADGAWLCELAPVGDEGALWEAVAPALGVAPVPGQGRDNVILDYLEPRQLLMVLDNCEHILGAAAEAVGAIGQRCPHVVVLATSREGLALPGEQLVAVPSLGVPAPGALGAELESAEAVWLFCDRARDADDSFSLDEHNSAAIAQLCRRLDGIPLAIELAAARVRSLSPADLVERLDQRFKLLTRGGRGGLERFEAAAVIFGFADAHVLQRGGEEYMTYLTAAETALVDALGQDRVAELKAKGATLPLSDVVDYLCAEADRALAE